jgi:hypothetical protein
LIDDISVYVVDRYAMGLSAHGSKVQRSKVQRLNNSRKRQMQCRRTDDSSPPVTSYIRPELMSKAVEAGTFEPLNPEPLNLRN